MKIVDCSAEEPEGRSVSDELEVGVSETAATCSYSRCQSSFSDLEWYFLKPKA